MTVHPDDFPGQVYREAAVLGLTFAPLWVLVTRATTFARISGEWKALLDVALTAAAYHIIAEDTGVTEWYLRHGAAVKKILNSTVEQVADGSVILTDVGWLCNSYPGRGD